MTRRISKRRGFTVGRPLMPKGTHLNVKWHFEFKREDCWVGLFWSLDPDYVPRSGSAWLCVLPMLPLHIDWWPTDPEGVL